MKKKRGSFPSGMVKLEGCSFQEINRVKVVSFDNIEV